MKKKVALAEAEVPKAQQFAAEAPAKTTAAQAKVDQLNTEYEKLLKEIPAAPTPPAQGVASAAPGSPPR